jgi:hypothetical protein
MIMRLFKNIAENLRRRRIRQLLADFDRGELYSATSAARELMRKSGAAEAAEMITACLGSHYQPQLMSFIAVTDGNWSAAKEIGSIANKALLAALRVYGDGREAFREAAARALVDTAANDCVVPLAAILDTDVDIHVKFRSSPIGFTVSVYNSSLYVVQTLGRLRDARARPVLEKWRDRPIQNVSNDSPLYMNYNELERTFPAQIHGEIGAYMQDRFGLSRGEHAAMEERATMILVGEVVKLKRAIVEALRLVPPAAG